MNDNDRLLFMTSFKKIFCTLLIAFSSQNAFAAFPQDFSDVVWVGPNIGGWPVTSELDITGIDGSYIYMPHSKRDSWPISCRFSASERVNASVWGFVKINNIWHAGTFEYLRAGGTTRKTYTFGGSGYFRPPIGSFRPVTGEVYGFMIAGVSRDSLSCNNVAERTNVVIWRWGVGEVAIEEPEPEPEEPQVNMAPVNTLLQ